MRTANQLTFTTYEASLKLKPNDPTKIICCASMEVGQLASEKFATTPPGKDIIKPNQEG